MHFYLVRIFLCDKNVMNEVSETKNIVKNRYITYLSNISKITFYNQKLILKCTSVSMILIKK